MYSNVLQENGYRTIEAATGEEGWEKAVSEHPDVVVLDLILPDIHGFEVLTNIRSYEPTKDIPVIILTTVKDTDQIQESKDLGANYYLNKGSASPDRVVEAIDELLSFSSASE
jgi:CheY-like chemotaxis protein